MAITDPKLIKKQITQRDRQLEKTIDDEVAKVQKTMPGKSKEEVRESVIEERWKAIASKELRELSTEDAFFILNHAPSQEELYVGREMLKRVLVAEGIEAMVNCVERIYRVVKRDVNLDMSDFTDRKGELNSYWRYLKPVGAIPTLFNTRREFLVEAGLQGLGAALIATGGVNLLAHITQGVRHPKRTQAQEEPGEVVDAVDAVDTVQAAVNDYATPAIELGTGGLSLAAGVEMWQNEKLNQVKKAVSEMVTRDISAEMMKNVNKLLEVCRGAVKSEQDEFLAAYNRLMTAHLEDDLTHEDFNNPGEITEDILDKYPLSANPWHDFLESVGASIDMQNPIRKFISEQTRGTRMRET